MVYSLTIPGYGEKNAKDYVITTLTQKYPLTKMRIYREAKKSGLSVTFHAVNKAINQLTESRVLAKNAKNYQLDFEWISKLRQFSESMSSKMLNKNGQLMHGVDNIKKEGNVTTLVFESIYDMDKYCKSLHDHYYSRLNKDECACLIYSHHWWNLLYPEKEYSNTARNKKFYCICTNNSPLDKAGIKFKRKLGMKVIHQRNAPFQDQTIYGDTIVQNIINKALKEELDCFFRKTKKVEDINPKELLKVLKKKGKVIVIVNKNKELAEEIKKRTLALF